MLIARIGGTKRPQIANWIPEWFFHQRGTWCSSKIWDSIIPKSGFNERKGPRREIVPNLRSSDTWVAEYRKWMDRIGHGMPYHFEHNTISLPELPVVGVHAPAGLIAGASASFPA
ncbi:hypothetical protein NC651_038024 [Populus alba x Populus x berolinensis]|nr:hypothetical protein NC651_038024 [Populus alba x Populus x berolinensis]